MTTARFPSTTIDTPVGRLYVWATSGDHVGITTQGYASGERQRRSYDETITAEEWETIAPSVILSRVGYTVRIDVHPRAVFDADADKRNAWNREPAAECHGWTLADHNAMRVSRVGYDHPHDGYGTPAARKQALRDVFVPLCEWLATGAGSAFLAEAARGKAEAERASAEAALATARDALAKAEAELAALTEGAK